MFDYIDLSWCHFVDFCLIGLDRRLFYYDDLKLILSAALWYGLELGVTPTGQGFSLVSFIYGLRVASPW